MSKLYSIEVVTITHKQKLVRKTHSAWTWQGAMEWVSMYHPAHGWAIAVKRLGRVVAMRGVHE